jgi:hypothetical protein
MKATLLFLMLLAQVPQSQAIANNPVRSAEVQAGLRNTAVSDATCLAMPIEQYRCFGNWPLDDFDNGMVQGYIAIAGTFYSAQICPGTTPIVWALNLIASADLTCPTDCSDAFDQGWNAAVYDMGQRLMSLEGYTPVESPAPPPDRDGLQPVAHTRLLQ